MDAYAEYMVKKQPDAKDKAKRTAIVILAVLLSALTIGAIFLTGIPFLLLITCAVLYGAYFLLSGLSVEYEYAVTNKELDVDKIIARRKRVHLITVDISKCEAYGPYTDDISDDSQRTLVLCSDNSGEGEFYLDAETEDYGAVRILFTPNDTVREVITAALPRQSLFHIWK